jgi:hypothetical protein
VKPASAASGISARSGAPLSIDTTSPAAASANRAATSSSTCDGPRRSITRPWTTEPSETPISEPADTAPATANDPLSRCT